MKKLLLTLFALTVCSLSVFAAVKGDVNGDGHVNSVDVTALYNWLLNGDASSIVNGDVDGDGHISSVDVTTIYNILLGNDQPAEHEWVDLGLPSGTLWATMNIGANSPEDYGEKFAWGETMPKEVYNWSNYQWCNGSENTLTKYCNMSNLGYNGFTDNKTELDTEDDAATANWGPEWCMPSIEQIQELCNNCTSVWTTQNGINGRLFTASNGASLFLPAAGSWINYWSRTLYSSYPSIAYGLYFTSSNVDGMSDLYRDGGFPVRAVRVQEHEYVDLGLPSGTLWATTNVGADSPEGYGDNFAWGETTPKDVYNWSTYQWCMGSYNTFTKYCNISGYGYNGFTDGKIELDLEDDAATANWGPDWRMPSQEQIQELYNNCFSEWTTLNGVNGRLFTGPNGASMFMPATGSFGNYWSRTLLSSDPYYAYILYFYSGSVFRDYSDRYVGQSVRAVRVQEHEYVDLGLPSGTLWATMNVGANSPEEYGDYFAWGETTPKDWYDWSTYQWWNGGTDAYALTKYCNNSEFGYNGFTDNKTELDPEDDAATANWGPEWRMPSLAQIKELYMNCTWVWTTQNGINGRLFTASNGASLFLPATGDRWKGEFKNVGSWGYYWSRDLFEYPNSAWSLYYITNESVGCNNVTRSYGFTVRAVRVP